MAASDAPLTLPDAVVHAIVAHARAASPREACGLLVGNDRQIAYAVATTNLARSERRYEVAPAEHFAVVRRARAEGLSVIGSYHSHPQGAAVPSPTDLAEAFPDFVFVIAALAPEAHVRAWLLHLGNFAEVALVRTDGRRQPSGQAHAEAS